MKRIGQIRQFGTGLIAYDGGYPGTGTPLPQPAGDSNVSVTEKVLGVQLFSELHPIKGAKPAPLPPSETGAK